jgi:hypothetical protein
MFNLQTILILAAEPLLKARCKHRKRCYQINRNVSLESLKRGLKGLFANGWRSLLEKLSFLIHRFLETLERILAVEPRPRKAKMSRLNARHQTEFNYKAAI